MDVYYYFNYMSSAWMVLEAIPLIVSPAVIIALLSPEVRESTTLEEYLSRSLGLTLVAFAVLLLLLTGSVPLTSSLSSPSGDPAGTDPTDPTAPYAVPALTVSLVYHMAVSFYCYTMWTAGHAYTYTISVVVHAGLAAIGLWVMMFGTSDGRISRKTGADKRTSGFPFKNVEAEKKNAGKKRV